MIQISISSYPDFYVRISPFSDCFRFRNISMNFRARIELSGMREEKVVGAKEPVRLGREKREIVQRGKKKTMARLSRRRDCVLMYGWHSDDNRDKLLY